MLNMLPKLALSGRENVLECIGERPAAFIDALAQYAQIRFEQDKVGGVFGHIHRGVHREAHVGGMQGRRVVDAIAHIADHVPGLAQRKDDAFLLVGIHFREDRGAFGKMPEGLVTQVGQLTAGQHTRDLQLHRLRDVPRHLLIIAGDEFDLHTAFRQIDDDLLHIGFWRIEEEQKAGESEGVFIGARIGFRPPVYRLRRHTEHTEAFGAPFTDTAARSLPASPHPAAGLPPQFARCHRCSGRYPGRPW